VARASHAQLPFGQGQPRSEIPDLLSSSSIICSSNPRTKRMQKPAARFSTDHRHSSKRNGRHLVSPRGTHGCLKDSRSDFLGKCGPCRAGERLPNPLEGPFRNRDITCIVKASVSAYSRIGLSENRSSGRTCLDSRRSVRMASSASTNSSLTREIAGHILGYEVI